MPPRFPCPNCAENRPHAAALCRACGYPNHTRTEDVSAKAGVTPSRKFQFRLRTLFACTTIAAIVFAATMKWGIDGFQERLAIALAVGSIPMPLIRLIRDFEKHYRNI